MGSSFRAKKITLYKAEYDLLKKKVKTLKDFISKDEMEFVFTYSHFGFDVRKTGFHLMGNIEAARQISYHFEKVYEQKNKNEILRLGNEILELEDKLIQAGKKSFWSFFKHF